MTSPAIVAIDEGRGSLRASEADREQAVDKTGVRMVLRAPGPGASGTLVAAGRRSMRERAYRLVLSG